MYLVEPLCFEAGTQFVYPNPMDGHARRMLESEIKRLLHASNATEGHALIIDTYTLSVHFRKSADQNRFYKAFDTIADFYLENVFTADGSTANKISNLRILSRQP